VLALAPLLPADDDDDPACASSTREVVSATETAAEGVQQSWFGCTLLLFLLLPLLWL
jgi:hypothetical protein